MNLEIYVKLDGEKASLICEKAKIRENLLVKANRDIIIKTGCDGVLNSASFMGGNHTSFFIGFKTQKDLAQYQKKKEYQNGYYIHTPRAKTEESALLTSWSKQLESADTLKSIINEAYPSFDFDNITSSGSGFGFVSPRFGMDASIPVVYGIIPYTKDFELHGDWVEVNASEINEFNENKKAA